MSTEEMNIQELESQFSEQERLRRDKLAELKSEGKDPFDVYKVDRTHTSEQVKSNFEDLEGKEVTVAGRIMSLMCMIETGKSNYSLRLMKLEKNN